MDELINELDMALNAENRVDEPEVEKEQLCECGGIMVERMVGDEIGWFCDSCGGGIPV